MAGPFEDPAEITGIDFAGLHGCLLIMAVKQYEDHVPTVHTPPGEKSPAVRVDVTVVDGNQAGTTIEDTLVFPRMLVAQLRPRLGKMVLGRLVQGEAQKGKNPPWRLDPATPQDQALAEAALNRMRMTGPAPVQQQPQQGYYASAGPQAAADPWAGQQPQARAPF